MSESNLDDVMRRIQKLLAIANDDRANPAEAAAAASMAEKVMRKYQVEHADILTRTLKTDASMKEHASTANMKRDDPKRPPLMKNPAWAGWLAYEIAKMNDCETRYGWMQGGAVVVFYGYDGDAQVSKWTFDYLVGILIAAMKTFQKGGGRSKAESESYRRGFVLAMCANIVRLARDKREEVRAAEEQAKAEAMKMLAHTATEVNARDEAVKASGSYALMITTKAERIADYFGKTNYRTTKNSDVRDSGAFVAGRDAGNKVDVGRRAVGSNGSPTLKLN